MSRNSLLIVNATLVNEGVRREVDVLIRKGRIERIESGLDVPAGRVIDAGGNLLLPGMIDDQVHFREPGLTHKGDFATESRAAVAGGITSFMEMPNTSPPTTNSAALEAKYQRAAGRSFGNYAFYLGATNDNLDNIKRLDPNAAAGIKVFMGSSTGNMLVDQIDVLDAIFAHAPTLVVTHCEDTPRIIENTRVAEERYGADIPPSAHPIIRDHEACLLSSTLAVGLARKHGTDLHVLHLTTADELSLFAAGAIGSKKITVEVCAHHLYFNDEDYEKLGFRIKCNPAIKTEADRRALVKAVADDVIDIIATDHAPHLLEEKQPPYARAAAGLPLVQDALPSLFSHVNSGALTVEKLVEKTAHNPAIRYAVKDRGFVREGYWADLVIVDPQQSYQMTDQRALAKCGWSPFAGTELPTSILTTIVSGEVAYADGVVTEDAAGRRIEFDR